MQSNVMAYLRVHHICLERTYVCCTELENPTIQGEKLSLEDNNPKMNQFLYQLTDKGMVEYPLIFSRDNILFTNSPRGHPSGILSL